LVESADRVNKEGSMRKRKLKRLWARLKVIVQPTAKTQKNAKKLWIWQLTRWVMIT